MKLWHLIETHGDVDISILEDFKVCKVAVYPYEKEVTLFVRDEGQDPNSTLISCCLEVPLPDDVDTSLIDWVKAPRNDGRGVELRILYKGAELDYEYLGGNVYWAGTHV